MNNNLPGYLLDKMLSSSTRFMSMMARVAPMYRVLAAVYKNITVYLETKTYHE